MQATNQALWLPAQWTTTLPVTAGTSLTTSPLAKEGFNLAHHVDDCPQQVKDNRRILAETTQLHGDWLWLNQTHSNIVLDDSNHGDNISADAMISRHPEKIAVVMTADCLPILLCSQNGDEVAAIHAGWQGLYRHIIIKTLEKLHTSAGEMYAWIGPCATQQNYEVDSEFYQRFCEQAPENKIFFQENRPGHYLADLVGIARAELQLHGIPEQNISGGKLCSIAEKRFFSYRRDGKYSGRMASFIAPI